MFMAAGIFFVLLDVAVSALGLYSFDIKHLLLVVALSVLFALAGWFQLFEFLFIGCYILLDSLDMVGGFGSVEFGLLIVLVFWMVRSWVVPAIVVMIVYGVLSTLVSPTSQLQALSSLLVSIVVLLIGLSLRWQGNRRMLAEFEKEQAQLASLNTRQELARQLHDTTAKDLAHVTMLAQDVAKHHPDLSRELRPLVAAAAEASRRIRPIITSVNTAATETPLSEVIAVVSDMLTTRNITLHTAIDGDIDNIPTRQQRLTAALAIRECGVNVLKYAPQGSAADLNVNVDLDSRVLAMSLTNIIAATPVPASVTSGYGLMNLKYRIQQEDGTLDISHIQDRWLVYVSLPSGVASEREN